ncbi:uncharacterized protein [Rutidosis leptorrhynchoides]|uniref:uncharacterized protein n=1 Tax=Rutidosis leptorrhynchoides TaxID=125765 RepID=UPI003A9A2DF4
MVQAYTEKINIFLWRLDLDRLPTRSNLIRRGVIVDDVSCPHCNIRLEDIHHTMFSCIVAKGIWRKVSLWVGVDITGFDYWSDWLNWFDQWVANGVVKNRIFVIVAASLWTISRFQNEAIFSEQSLKANELFDCIRYFSFTWISSGCKASISWTNWLIMPL